MWLFFYYTIQLITIKLCTKFRSPNSSSCWEIFDRKNVHMYYIYKREEGKNENLKKEGKMRISILISIYTVHFAILKMYTKFENTDSNRSWEICDRIFPLERKKNEQIKGLISNMWLFFCYTIQLITIKLRTKFQSPNPSSCWEIFDGKKSLQTDKQTDRQTNNIIAEKAKTIYPLYTSYRG